MKTVHIPVEKILEVTRTVLLRQWWETYYYVLRGDIQLSELNALTAELERRRIVTEGCPMPTDGADDLVDKVTEIKKAREL